MGRGIAACEEQAQSGYVSQPRPVIWMRVTHWHSGALRWNDEKSAVRWYLVAAIARATTNPCTRWASAIATGTVWNKT
jgi:hypothetical protein